ncbi:hypothetical protein JVU11DRAFT_4282 [Chiua virens]|nr:hypothetical protein JVU11DRAFT_4282 [Chiua virens]
MAPSQFNEEFTDADEQRLLHFASFTHDPQNVYHTCFWATAHGPCNTQILGSEISDHLRSRHSVTVPDDVVLMCRWSGCSTELRKGCLVRHIQEKHLEWRYTCPQCGERFTRNYTRRNHLSRRHGVN